MSYANDKVQYKSDNKNFDEIDQVYFHLVVIPKLNIALNQFKKLADCEVVELSNKNFQVYLIVCVLHVEI